MPVASRSALPAPILARAGPLHPPTPALSAGAAAFPPPARREPGGLRAKMCFSRGNRDVGSLTRYDETAVTTNWQNKLIPEQFYVTREKGTEPPFTGIYLNNTDPGMYHCVCCNAPPFRSAVLNSLEKKYNSGTGWPLFSEAFGLCGTDESNTNILRCPDNALGSTSTEVICKQCDAHLGHMFDDSPRPSGQRFCINSVSLTFKPNLG